MADVNRPRGPVELIVVALSAEPDGSIAAAIADKVEAGVINILDLLYIRLSEDGELIVLEADNIGGELEVFGFEADLPGLIGEEDARAVGEALPPGTAVACRSQTWRPYWPPWRTTSERTRPMMGRRMGRGRGRPGLLGMAARTAVVAGTATAVSNNVSRRQQGRQQEQADAQAYEQQQADYDAQQRANLAAQQAAAQQAAAAPAPDDTLSQLQQLADLKQQGLLTDEEFSAAKAKLLGA
jgi:hypothetical protein